VTVAYLDREAPAPADQIERLERRIGRPLPDEYRSFLRQQDGGRLADNTEAVKEVFGLAPTVPEYANLWHKLDVYSSRVPDWLLPVASDEFGNLFAISTRDEDLGSVWFWDHEEEADEGEPPTEENLRYRAPDWQSFLNGLEPMELDETDYDE
jgi:hypothetical protein